MARNVLRVPTVVEQIEQLEGVKSVGAYPSDERHDGPVGLTIGLTDEVAQDPDYLPDEIEGLLPDGAKAEVSGWPNPDEPNTLNVLIVLPVWEVQGGGYF